MPCYNDVNGYKTITDYWSADSVPTAYCSMHKSVSICTESGLLATDYCPSYSVESRGIVLIPRGHPLYDYIDTYGDTIRKYLGEFAHAQEHQRYCEPYLSDSRRIHRYAAAFRTGKHCERCKQSGVYGLSAGRFVAGSHQRYPPPDQYRHQRGADAALPFPDRLYFAGRQPVSNLRSQLQAAGLM